MLRAFPFPALRLRKWIAACLLAFVATIHPGHAATTDTVSFSALCFSPSVATEPTFFIATGGGREKVQISVTSLGGPFKASVREGGLLDFFASEADKQPALSVKLPTGTRERLLLVFAPAANGAYQARAMTLPADGFDGGSRLAINVAPVEVAVRYGANPMQVIKPGSFEVLPLPASHHDPMLPVQIFKRGASGEWEIAQNSRWAVDRRFRSYLFLFPSPEGGALGIHAVPERLPGT